jgi:hypothetical protein
VTFCEDLVYNGSMMIIPDSQFSPQNHRLFVHATSKLGAAVLPYRLIITGANAAQKPVVLTDCERIP